ncbi:glycosyltransferase, group 1 family protein [Corynebacterium ammoniagenes DSM 20306]|nr:glycosyltransferase, group 1 family protein [Corynebacterium ammoniagenes DSM 20306]
MLDLATVFIEQGHFVQVLGPASKDTDVPDFVVKGGGAIPITYNGSVARLAIGPHVTRHVKKFIRDGNFDVLHIHEPNSPSYSMRALSLVEGPIVATYHASAASSRVLQIFRPVLNPMLEKIRGGIAVSEMARRWQVEQLGGDPILIPNGVDTSVYAAARQHHVSASAELTAPDVDGGTVDTEGHDQENNRLEIVFLGRLDESRKGLDVLLDALEHIHRPIRVTIMGGGHARSRPGVDFVGRVSDLDKATILGRADIYVAPNRGGESFGIVLVEAMAAGCAVIASDLEAFAAVCDADSEQPAGLLFKNGDSRDLAAKITHLIDNEHERKQLIAAGVERAQQYDWDHVAAAVMQVYETVQDGTKVRIG